MRIITLPDAAALKQIVACGRPGTGDRNLLEL